MPYLCPTYALPMPYPCNFPKKHEGKACFLTKLTCGNPHDGMGLHLCQAGHRGMGRHPTLPDHLLALLELLLNNFDHALAWLVWLASASFLFNVLEVTFITWIEGGDDFELA